MADNENDLPDDQTNDTDPEKGGLEGANEQQGVTADQLQARVAELEALNTKQSRDLIAAIGRLQSLDERLSKGNGDAEAVATLKAGLETANEMLDALLEDEAIDPKVKDRARGTRAKAQATADRAEVDRLRREIETLKNPPRQAAAPDTDNSPTPFEEGLVAAIEAAGLDPDDADLFDWKGEATRVLKSQGQRAVLAYFKKQIAAGLEAKGAATRREGRRTAGLNQSGGAAGGATDPLDPSHSLNDRYAELQRMGAV